MTKARGKVRELLLCLGEIQELAGAAKGVYLNDVARDRAGQLLPLLDQIFRICLDERSKYEPITTTEEVSQAQVMAHLGMPTLFELTEKTP